MKFKVATIGILLVSSSLLSAGEKTLVEPQSPIVDIQKEEHSSFYVSGAVFYNNVYSTEYAWFNAGTDTQDELAGLTLIAGYDYNDILALEARVSQSLLKEDYATEYHASLFLKPQYKFRDLDKPKENYYTVYGLLGVGYVHVDGVDGNTPAATEVIGENIISTVTFQYGLGVSYTIVNSDYKSYDKGSVALFMEYNQLLTDGDISSRLYEYNAKTYKKLSMNGLNVGLSYHF
jgi:hypothetical protein